MTKRWAPGACKLLAWEKGVALLDSEISDEQAETLWTTVQHEAKLATFLQALMEATGAGLLNIPPFAVAILDERGAHVAVRGGWLVSVRTADQDIRLNGENITTWEEKLVAGAVAVELQTSGSHDRHNAVPFGLYVERPTQVGYLGMDIEAVHRANAQRQCGFGVSLDRTRGSSQYGHIDGLELL